MEKLYDVAIVGAGPAGLFAAYELITNNKKLKVILIDKGRKVEMRHCPMNERHIACQNCNPCHILSGMGGAGTFSDGKLNFIPKLGKSDLFKYMGTAEAFKLIDDTEEIFNKFEMDSDIFPSNMKAALTFQKEVVKLGANYLLIKQKHIGSDVLPSKIELVCNYLEKSGITILDNTNVKDIEIINIDLYNLITETDLKEGIIQAKKVIVAPGRVGAKWVQELADKYQIQYLSQSIEIGVRVEVKKEILEDLCKVIYDPTIFIKTNTYNDQVRTFCTNPGGYVTKENYYGYICVNGHALKNKKSNNSNFAFISRVSLTEPVTNTREYGESIAKIANCLGDSKPIIQTLKDLRKGRRSTWHRIDKNFVEPTLKECVAGDLALILPYRIIKNILEGLEQLDKIIPGVNNDETLLYGPEIKFYSNEIETNNNFKLEKYNIYFVGDGAGKAGNIVVASATGLVAARDILNNK